MKNEFEKNGFVILKNVIENSMFEHLKFLSELYTERTFKRQNHTGNAGHNLFRTDNIIQDFLLPELFNNEKIYQAVSDILGNDFILQEVLHYFSMPDNSIQKLHKDVDHLFPIEKLTTPTFVLGIQIPMIDFDYESGGTRIVPGTHLDFETPTDLDHENLDKVFEYTPVLKERDCIIRDCRAWHGAGTNNSEKVRAMFTIAFAKRWFGKPAKVSKDFYFNLDRDKRHLVTL